MKQIRISWAIFLILITFLFLLGVVVGVIITPLKLVEETTTEPEKVSEDVGKAEPPVRAIGDIKPPKNIKMVDPIYPEEARQARVKGKIILETTTDIFGKVKRVKVLKSNPPLEEEPKIDLLYEAAIDAVKQWEFEPMIINGRSREVIFTVTVNFRLKKKQSV